MRSTVTAPSWRWGLLCLVLPALGFGAAPPPAREPAGPFLRTAPATLALGNLPIIRALQEARAAHTLLVGIRGFIGRDGRVTRGDAWGYELMDLGPNRDVRYAWGVFSDGRIVSFDPLPAVRPASAVDIGAMIRIDSDLAVRIAEEFGGRDYFERHPGAGIRIRYFHIAGRVVCRLGYFDLTRDADGCEITVDLDAGSGELLSRDAGCLGP